MGIARIPSPARVSGSVPGGGGVSPLHRRHKFAGLSRSEALPVDSFPASSPDWAFLPELPGAAAPGLFPPLCERQRRSHGGGTTNLCAGKASFSRRCHPFERKGGKAAQNKAMLPSGSSRLALPVHCLATKHGLRTFSHFPYCTQYAQPALVSE